MGYLKLSRRAGERILVGDSITITVLDTRGNTVRLGFEAPKEIVIDREEIAWQKRKIVSLPAPQKTFHFDKFFGGEG